MIIRPANFSDATEIASIYNNYILTSHATFEVSTLDRSEMEQRMHESVDHGYPFIVADNDERVDGFCYGRQFRPRSGYRHAVEVAVYVREGSKRLGLGFSLYRTLIPKLFNDGFHTIIATISLPNDASVRLHEKFGFEKAGQFREVGRKFERWIDVGYWQLINSNPQTLSVDLASKSHRSPP